MSMIYNIFLFFLELAKFNKKPHELKTMIEKWAYFFKYAEDTTQEELVQIIGSDSIIEKAYETLDKFNYTFEEMEGYDNFERSLDAYNTLLEDREARGKAEGKAEEKIDVVKKLKNMGMAIEVIQQATGLSSDEISEI